MYDDQDDPHWMARAAAAWDAVRMDAAQLVAGGIGDLLGRRTGTQAPIIDSDGEYWRSLTMVSGIAHRLVWCVPLDGLTDGWTTTTDDNDDESRDFDRDQEAVQAWVEAWAAAREQGGAWVWPVTDGDWRTPIGPGPHDISATQVLTRAEVRPAGQWESDPADVDWSDAELLQITPNRDGGTWAGAVIHRSRLIYVPGKRITPGPSPGGDGYDLSVLSGLADAIRELERGWRSIGDTLQRRSTPYVKFGARSAKAGARGVGSSLIDSIARKLDIIAIGIRNSGLIGLQPEDEMGWVAAPLDGLDSSIRTLALWVSAQTGIPITRFLGEQAAGLSNDDAPGTDTYRSSVATLRRLDIEPALLRWYALAFGPDDSRTIIWPEVTTPSEAERATTAQGWATALSTLVTSGVMSSPQAAAVFFQRLDIDIPDVPGPEAAPALLPLGEDVPPPADEDGAPRMDAAYRPKRLPMGALASYRDGIRRHEAGETGDGLEPITVRQARAFVGGDRPTPAWIRKAAAWWARNGAWVDAEKGSPAYAAAQLWGGRAGRRYYEREAARLEGDE